MRAQLCVAFPEGTNINWNSPREDFAPSGMLNLQPGHCAYFGADCLDLKCNCDTDNRVIFDYLIRLFKINMLCHFTLGNCSRF